MKRAAKFQYRFRCSDMTMADVQDLNAMVEVARRITFKTFAKHCNWVPFAKDCGYAATGAGLRLSQDYAVSFYKSKWRGQPCYYVLWSAYECVFLGESDDSVSES